MKVYLLLITVVCFTACVEDRIIYERMPVQDGVDHPIDQTNDTPNDTILNEVPEPTTSTQPEQTHTPSTPEPEVTPTPTAPPEPEPQPEPMRPQPSMSASCELELQWQAGFGDDDGQAFRGMPMPGGTDVLPGSNLIVSRDIAGHAPTAYRVSDGEKMFEFEYDAFNGTFDHNWHQRVSISSSRQGTHLVLEPVLDAPELWRVDLPLSTYNMWARFTPDASRVVLLGCEEGQGFARTYLATTGELDREVELGERCLDHLFGNGILSEFTHDGEIMIIAEHNPFAPTASDSSITRIDFRTGQVTQVPFPDGASGALLSMDLSPTSNRLAAINSAGEVYHWTFPDMTPLESLGRAGLLRINPRTYMPSTESPIQFSPDGSLLAHIDLDQNIVVVDAHTQELRYRLDLSQFAGDDITHNGNIGSEVVDLVFTDDGQSLIARLAFGLVAYRCADSIDPQGRDNLSVLLDVPGDIHVGESVELTATHLDASHFHGHAFYVNGALLTIPTTGRHAQWEPIQAGVYEIAVELIDGVNTGRATRFVHVMP
jgi:hypothetical protein